MPLNLASPGILVREVDLTIGRIDPTTDKIGGIVGPFAQGPVGTPTLLQTENDLLNQFGKPYDTDKQYETWLTASSYLAYGGQLNVIRADDASLANALVGTAVSTKIKSVDNYEELGYDTNVLANVTVCAKNPGSWANGLRVGILDARADQTLGVSTTGVDVFSADISNRSGTVAAASTAITGITTTSIVVGQDINDDTGALLPVGATVYSISAAAGGTVLFTGGKSKNSGSVAATFDFGDLQYTLSPLAIGMGITQTVPSGTVISKTGAGAGTTEALDGHFKGIVTEIGTGTAGVKFISHVSAAGTETPRDYNNVYKFGTGTIGIHSVGQSVATGVTAISSTLDWFDQQELELTASTIGGDTKTTTVKWNTVTDRPGTSEYVGDRGGRFDEVHVVVIDGKGLITGNAGTILEKHQNLSKAKDATFSAGSPSYWRKYIETNSEYLFATNQPVGVVTTGFDGTAFAKFGDGGWNQDADGNDGNGVIFDTIGNSNNTLSKGVNYAGIATITDTGALNSGLDDLVGGYTLFENDTNVDVDFLLMGSAKGGEYHSRALATKLIAVAEKRQDAIAFISPYRQAMISDNLDQDTAIILDDDTITNNVIDFFDPITSSSYAVFDSGYKFMFDRFANTFRYIPLNGDIAGTCARNDINNFPWFSPAGTARGTILNAIKLAYNPSKDQRDRLYTARVNPVIFSPGSGIILFGDKTGFAKASAFDRINVRRLFIYLEDAISAAAKDQLFEFNDEITRSNFLNIVEPFLRDVQAKRGIQDYVVICDETNNTAAVIDANEFIADIYIKPARSINFIGLTFVATRTGVAFEEVIGNV